MFVEIKSSFIVSSIQHFDLNVLRWYIDSVEYCEKHSHSIRAIIIFTERYGNFRRETHFGWYDDQIILIINVVDDDDDEVLCTRLKSLIIFAVCCHCCCPTLRARPSSISLWLCIGDVMSGHASVPCLEWRRWETRTDNNQTKRAGHGIFHTQTHTIVFFGTIIRYRTWHCGCTSLYESK